MNSPQLILRFGTNYHLDAFAKALVEMPASEVRAIYHKDEDITVETIDGKHMQVTSKEIEIVPCIS
jgi:hypothetical protein